MKTVLVALLIILSVLSLYVYDSRHPYATHTLAGKAEWGNLQTVYRMELERLDAVASSSSDKSDSKIIKKFGNEYLFINREGLGESVIILLNCESPPYYKQFPHQRGYLLTQEEFQLISDSAVTPTVRLALISHLNIKK